MIFHCWDLVANFSMVHQERLDVFGISLHRIHHKDVKILQYQVVTTYLYFIVVLEFIENIVSISCCLSTRLKLRGRCGSLRNPCVIIVNLWRQPKIFCRSYCKIQVRVKGKVGYSRVHSSLLKPMTVIQVSDTYSHFHRVPSSSLPIAFGDSS